MHVGGNILLATVGLAPMVLAPMLACLHGLAAVYSLQLERRSAEQVRVGLFREAAGLVASFEASMTLKVA